MPKKETPKSFDDVLRTALKDPHQSAQARRKRASHYKNQKAKKVSKTFTDLMGPPPLLKDEDPAQYYALYEILRLKFNPRDIIEEIYVRHIMDDTWAVTRYRRMNAHMLNMAQPTMGDEWQLRIERYRNSIMGSEDLSGMKNENLILHDFSQYSCFTPHDDLIVKQFEKRISEINLIEIMISRCMERMRRSHLTLDDFRNFVLQAVGANGNASQIIADQQATHKDEAIKGAKNGTVGMSVSNTFDTAAYTNKDEDVAEDATEDVIEKVTSDRPRGTAREEGENAAGE